MRFVSRYVVYGAWRFDDLWTFEILGNRMILDEVSNTTNFSSYVTTKMLAVYDIRPSPFHANQRRSPSIHSQKRNSMQCA